MKKFSFLLFLVFSPVAIVTGTIGIPEKGKLKIEMVETKIISKTVKERTICDSLFVAIASLSKWQTASASYYDPKDSCQTRKNCDGLGAFKRLIKSGSIGLGSSFTKKIRERGLSVYIKIKDFDTYTPFGKGIFRVDDIMSSRYNKKDNFHIDFYPEDLSLKQKLKGRFRVKFKMYKIETANI